MGYLISAFPISINLCGVKFPMTIESKVKDCEHIYAICIGTQNVQRGLDLYDYSNYKLMECVSCRTSILDKKNDYFPTIYKKRDAK